MLRKEALMIVLVIFSFFYKVYPVGCGWLVDGECDDDGCPILGMCVSVCVFVRVKVGSCECYCSKLFAGRPPEGEPRIQYNPCRDVVADGWKMWLNTHLQLLFIPYICHGWFYESGKLLTES